MFTSNYKEFNGNDYREVSISGDRGKSVGYEGECYPDLAPKKEFWQVWHDNIGKISEEENNKYYVREYYKQVLSKLDPDTVYFDLRENILLCYEEPQEFCHRAIAAAWIKILFGEEVLEIKTDNNRHFQSIKSEKLNWIEEYLEQLIRENTPNMRGFTSLMALRLFEKGKKYDSKGYELDEIIKNMYIEASKLANDKKIESEKLQKKANDLDDEAYSYHFEAAGLRCQADDSEHEYLKKHSKKLVKTLIK